MGTQLKKYLKLLRTKMYAYRIYTNGCEALRFDGSKLEKEFLSRGFHAAVEESTPDVCVVTGCTFSQERENDFQQMVADLIATKPPQQKIIVSGCYLAEDAVKGVVYSRIDDVGHVLDRLIAAGELQMDSASAGQAAPLPFVAVSEGCYGRCTFCSIRLVRGRHQSRAERDIISDVKAASAYHDRVKLVGQEVAAYGKDVGTNLPELIKKLFAEIPDLRLELASLGPTWASKFSSEELSVFADERIMGNIHISLQSASDAVLGRMARGYTFSEFVGLVSALKDAGVKNFSTDLIAGFPGETEEDHEQSLRFLRETDLQFAQLFMYEPRPGTEAAEMEQIPREIRLRRTLDLIATFASNSSRFRSDETLSITDFINTNIDLTNEEVPSYES